MSLKLPRTIQLDASDRFVFAEAAEPGEWAVTGSFLFLDIDPNTLTGKDRTAFRSGFVGVRTLGFSTLVVVSEASEAERDEAVESLADQIEARLGAPSRRQAVEAAREEIAVAASLCAPEVGSVLALHRTVEDGAVREQFRTLRPRERTGGADDLLHARARAFTFVEVDEEPAERVDLVDLAAGGRS